ncbi:MAG TPA: fumarate reductase subunit C [Thermoanaerobaculia bacterium]|nr:fumarate reductase subunit C [Thermoanaerobaculia bacterium]
MNPAYRPHHPRWHRERMPIFWWLGQPAYVKFITRELTSLAVGYGALLLLAEVYTLERGPAAHDRFLHFLAAPPVLVFHLLVCAALLFHTVTWLNLAPKALVVRLGGRRLPDWAVVAGHYLLWLAASGAVVVWLLRGGS